MALLSASGPAPSAAQTLVDGASKPWSAIGRLNAGGKGFCSGALVGPDTVLTAAHCLYNFASGNWWPPADIHFVAGYDRGQWVGHARARGIIRDPSYLPRQHPRADSIAGDWAVVVLDAPIGRKAGWLAFTGSGMPKPGMLTLQLGYRRDRPHAPLLSRPCRVERATGGVALHDCDVPEGGSGSPLLSVVDGRLTIVGVHSARLASPHKVQAAAVLLSGLTPLPHPPPLLRREDEAASLVDALRHQWSADTPAPEKIDQLMRALDSQVRHRPSGRRDR